MQRMQVGPLSKLWVRRTESLCSLNLPLIANTRTNLVVEVNFGKVANPSLRDTRRPALLSPASSHTAIPTNDGSSGAPMGWRRESVWSGWRERDTFPPIPSWGQRSDTLQARISRNIPTSSRNQARSSRILFLLPASSQLLNMQQVATSRQNAPGKC